MSTPDRDPQHLDSQLRWILDRVQQASDLLGHPIALTEGLRSDDRQAELYALGRTVVSHVGVTRTRSMGLTVTNAMAGQSRHRPNAEGFGEALDFHFAEGEPWGEDQPWELIGILFETLGCEWGGRWVRWGHGKGDRPHVQLHKRQTPTLVA